MHHVAIFYDILLTLHAHFTSFLYFGLTAVAT